MTWKVRMVFTNEDNILVKVLRQYKGYSAKNGINILTSSGHVQRWTDCCGEINAMGSIERK